MTAKQLIERYAKRWLIENQLSAQIRAFHLDALASKSRSPLTSTPPSQCASATRSTATFALRLHNGYQTATPDTIFLHFIEGPGELQFTPKRCQRRLYPRARAHTPVLLDAGYHERTHTIPWWTDASSATASRPHDPSTAKTRSAVTTAPPAGGGAETSG